MKIDAHQHFWAIARGDYGWMDGPGLAAIRRDVVPSELAPILARNGIDRTVLVQAAPSIAETHYMLGLADATEWIGKVVGWVNFDVREDLAELGKLARHAKFAGIRPMIQDIADPDWMLRPDVRWGFDAVRDLDLTFDALGFPIHFNNFLKLFNLYPDTRIVIDHCLKPRIRDGAFDEWAVWMERVAGETSVLCKLSGLATEAKPGWTVETLLPYAEDVLRVFGPDRVMWGSDWPVVNLNGSYESWLSAAQSYVPKADHDAVFGVNAARFYRIS